MGVLLYSCPQAFPQEGDRDIVRAKIDDLPDLVEFFARSFADDPFLLWLLREGRAYPSAIRSFFNYVLTIEGFSQNMVLRDASSGAFAIWLPSGKYSASAKHVSRLRRMLFILRVCGVRRAVRFFKIVKMSASHMPLEQHFYLHFMCVDPSRQNGGLGTRFMGDCLSRLDDLGMPTYLEISKHHNLRFYRQFGYRRLGSYQYSNTTPPMLQMWRDVGAAGT